MYIAVVSVLVAWWVSSDLFWVGTQILSD
jgi:hypothetical protein